MATPVLTACPWCDKTITRDDTETYWCDYCGIAWFRWTPDQEALRLTPPLRIVR
jgi:hypothetical protein